MASTKKSPGPSKSAKAKMDNKKYVDAGVRKELGKVNFKALAGMGSEGPKKRKPKPKITSSARKSR